MASRASVWVLATSLALLVGAALSWTLRAADGSDPPVIRQGALLTVDRQALVRVDLAAIHEELIPAWVVASSDTKGTQFRRIRAEAGQDVNLGALLDRMEVLREADPVLNAAELLGLVRTWNAYLAKAGQPWRLAGEVQVGDGGGQLLLKSYRVVFDQGAVTVGAHRFDVEIRRRVDRTSLVDAWLGHVHDPDDGVVVLLDRVTAFSLDQVWLQRSTPFTVWVRVEVASKLDSESLPLPLSLSSLGSGSGVHEIHEIHEIRARTRVQVVEQRTVFYLLLPEHPWPAMRERHDAHGSQPGRIGCSGWQASTRRRTACNPERWSGWWRG